MSPVDRQGGEPLLPPLTGRGWLDAILYGLFVFVCVSALFAAMGGGDG